MSSLKRLREPKPIGELLPALTGPGSQQGRGRRPWPHGTIPTAEAALLAAESVWRSWWQLHQAGRDREAGQAMARIHRTSFRPIDLFALWGEARRAHEEKTESKGQSIPARKVLPPLKWGSFPAGLAGVRARVADRQL